MRQNTAITRIAIYISVLLRCEGMRTVFTAFLLTNAKMES
jgi:hypothetical protein